MNPKYNYQWIREQREKTPNWDKLVATHRIEKIAVFVEQADVLLEELLDITSLPEELADELAHAKAQMLDALNQIEEIGQELSE